MNLKLNITWKINQTLDKYFFEYGASFTGMDNKTIIVSSSYYPVIKSLNITNFKAKLN